ncbi:uncharacterized protein [Solanum tuberosum]|uniref:uncharacterized protein n=1 Tax=Solanum tuberosum TaxID=4113 RepID=UPI00073A5073|nr:PREDICTED: uncharacterized protein LOC107058743 [Solanum tuberosum]
MVDQQVDPISSGSTSTVRMDIPSPFYLHPSENAAVLKALSVKSKTSFINGKLAKPNPDDPSFQQWERCDDMITSWILNSLSPNLRDSLQYVNNAEELWAELEDSCVCTCGGKIKLVNAEQDRRLIHFLMGRNEIYTVIRGNILMMSSLPSMAQTFSILSQEEKQREVILAPAGALCFVTSAGEQVTQEKMCYKLHGYPSNSKFSKGKSVVSAANICTSENDRSQCEEEPELRK